MRPDPPYPLHASFEEQDWQRIVKALQFYCEDLKYYSGEKARDDLLYYKRLQSDIETFILTRRKTMEHSTPGDWSIAYE